MPGTFWKYINQLSNQRQNLVSKLAKNDQLLVFLN